MEKDGDRGGRRPVDEAPDRGDALVRQQVIDEGAYALEGLGKIRLSDRYPGYGLKPGYLFNGHLLR